MESLYPPPLAVERPRILQAANAALVKGLAADPGNAAALALMSRLEVERGNPIAAVLFAHNALQADSRDAFVLRSVALSYETLGFYEAALEMQQRRRAIEATPMSVYHDAVLLSRMGRSAEAIEIIEGLQRQYPDICTMAAGASHIHLWNRDMAMAERYAVEWRACTGESSAFDAPQLSSVVAIAEALKGNRSYGREVVEQNADQAPAAIANYLLACAYAADPAFATQRIRAHPHFGNYRWLAAAPLPPSLLASPELHSLAEELYGRWQWVLSEAGADIVGPLPPGLPPPAEWLHGNRSDVVTDGG
jgi:tetratricopeptide (TPR) repeat protein